MTDSSATSAPREVDPAVARIALAGNPNTGKTTVFNRLTGSDRKVGNYPGVTVERHVGRVELSGGRVAELLDTPGAYSLSARSREEELAIQSIAGLEGEKVPDLVVVVLDVTQLSRNLYLALQVIELGVPVVLALNMTDMLVERGETLDAAAIERALGVPVVQLSAARGRGIDELRAVIERSLADPDTARGAWSWKTNDPRLLADLAAIAPELPERWTHSSARRVDALGLWALLSLDDDDELTGIPDSLRRVTRERRAAAGAAARNIESEVIRARYDWIDARMPGFLRGPERTTRTTTERIDHVLLNPFLGFGIFLVLMGLVFQALFTWADPLMQVVEAAFDGLASVARALISEGLVRDFVCDALIAGVGSVVVFLPQILMLFLFIGILEDTGYMARVAFLMDRIMRLLGLHGRAFVPMLSGYACAVPAILATRTMERQRDRTLTMMVVPLMTCSARLPVYALVIAALFPPSHVLGFVPVQGGLMVAMYLFSTLTALVAAAVLSRTLFRGPRVPLILELPPYRMPHWPSVVRLLVQRSRGFLEGAGGVILACSIVLWLLLSFPRSAEQRVERDQAIERVTSLSLPDAERQQRTAAIDARFESEALRDSYAGRLGRAFEPVIEPLGFDWKIGVGLIGAFAAREVFVSTMGVVYGAGKDSDEESATLRETIRSETNAEGKRVYTPLMGLSLMVFFALACQCMSTLAAVRRETKTWRWPIFLFVYMTVLAWLASFAVFQGGRALGFE